MAQRSKRMSARRRHIAPIALVLVAASGLAQAQSFEGDAFEWTFEAGLVTPPSTATVGPGPEFSFSIGSRTFQVDIIGSTILITAMFGNPSSTDTWGNDGTTLLGQLRITGLDSTDGPSIGAASISGLVSDLDDGDVEFTSNSVFLGASLPDANTFTWANAQFVQINLSDGCPGPNVVNIDTGEEFGTLANAIAAASRGDMLELGPCVYTERGLVLGDKDITIRGAGIGTTFIDGEQVDGAIFEHFDDTSIIEDLTIRNGRSSAVGGGGAVRIEGQSSLPVYRRVKFLNNRGDGAVGGAIRASQAGLIVDSCDFDGNSTPSSDERDIDAAFPTTVRVFNSVFKNSFGRDASILVGQLQPDSIVRVVNNTFVRGSNRFAAAFFSTDGNRPEVSNCVIDSRFGSLPFRFAMAPDVGLFRNVGPGNDPSNTPVFVDRENGDFRLAPGSPGIDAANFNRFAVLGGGLFDNNGSPRLLDDPNTDNFDPSQPALDVGAFESPVTPASNPCAADLALPFGVLDLDDIDAFINSFQVGCP